MAMNVAEGEQMIAAARAIEVELMVAHMWRYRDEVRALRARIEAASSAAWCARTATASTRKWGPAGWFTDPALAGGGALIDMGIHAIDTARYLLGDPERYACGRRSAPRSATTRSTTTASS